MYIDQKLKQEQENFIKYKDVFEAKDIGPFSSGKILEHCETLKLMKSCPEYVKPITIEWHLTNLCQHKCPSCMYKNTIHATNDRAKSIKNPIKILEDLNDLGVKGIVYSGGGEPLVYKEIDTILMYGRDFGISQGLITNGGLLDKHINTVSDSCEWVRISLDAGSEQSRFALHGVNDYAHTIDNIEKLVLAGNGRVRVGVSYLLTTNNANDLQRAVETVKRAGANYIQIKPMIMSQEDKIASENIFWDESIFITLKNLYLYESDTFKVYILGQQFLNNFDGHKNFAKCHGHALYPVITATGDVYVCCMQIGNKNNCYGRITADNSFKDIWNSVERFKIGQGIDINCCPKLCRLSQTNQLLEQIMKMNTLDCNFLN